MSVDPLDKYRKKPTQASQAQPDDEADEGFPEEEKGYMAYRQGNKAKRIIVKRRVEAHRAPGYSYLVDVMWDGDQGEEIGLVFSHTTIMIRGKHLQDLARQLATEKVQFIQEFDPQKWDHPGKGEPIIESIEFTTRVTAPLKSEEKKVSLNG